jgi:hypothetical protein
MFRKILFFLGSLILLSPIFMSVGTAFAATSSGHITSSSIDLAALQKSCSVVTIHLNGSHQPTFTCTLVRQNGVQPDLQRDFSCGDVEDTVFI